MRGKKGNVQAQSVRKETASFTDKVATAESSVCGILTKAGNEILLLKLTEAPYLPADCSPFHKRRLSELECFLKVTQI